MGANSSIYIIVSVCQEKFENCANFFLRFCAHLSCFSSNWSPAWQAAILACSFFFLFVFVCRVKSKSYELWSTKYAFYVNAYIWKSFPFGLNVYADVYKTILFGMTTRPDKYATQHVFETAEKRGSENQKKCLLKLQLKWHKTPIAMEQAKTLKQSMNR